MSAETSLEPQRYPSQIKYIVGNEACERFSYYGMRSILVVFMIQTLMMAENNSKAIYHLFVGACYLLPLLGGYISDRFLGKYKTIIYLSLVYCLGHAALAASESRTGLYLGLGLIALGSGGIKPCVSAHVGDQFTEKNKHLVKSVYDIFYFSVNFGSFFSTLLIPWVLVRYGANVAFGIPGVLMLIATVVFWMGKKSYIIIPPTGKTGKAGFAPVLFYSLINIGKKKVGESFLDVAKEKYKEDEVEGAKAAWSILKVFATVSVFWALYDQQGSSWVLQAQRMDRNLFGFEMQASQIHALNPILVMIMIPTFSFWLYPTIEKLGFKMTPLRRMTIGMFLAAIAFGTVGVIEMGLEQGQHLSVAWQLIPFVLLTAAEIMVSITGLEFAYTQAPLSMKGTIMSFWQLTVFVGNMLTAYVAKINVFQGSTYFHFFTLLTAVVSVLFAFTASRYRVKDFLSDNAALNPATSGVT